ncbi:MAG: hypothetical protein B7Y41_09255 [Hydrogenophilales bacterium 28-61-23]|nr:MAG: hypothetical protein B7Y41_09255 [Hydrogenophilales bacterium 28-61-23]
MITGHFGIEDAQAKLHDRGGGLIYDDVLNITWLQNSFYSWDHDGIGVMSLQDAKSWAANLAYYDSVRNVTWNDWRLPKLAPVGSEMNYIWSNNGSTDNGFNNSGTNTELGYMYYINFGNVGFCKPNGYGLSSSCELDLGFGLKDGPAPDDESLFHIPKDISLTYWIDSTYNPDPVYGWSFDMIVGSQGVGIIEKPMSNTILTPPADLYAWAVRDGDVAAVPEPTDTLLMLVGLAAVGLRLRKRLAHA